MKKEKIFNVVLYLLIFLAILSIILLKKFGNLDEIWNYSFARNIANGLIPYKDFNIIITPLVSIVCGFILKVTFDELIIMRIIGAFFCSQIIYMIYRLFSILNIKKEISIIFTFFIAYLIKDVYCIDYNFISLLLVIIIIYKEIKLYQKDTCFIKASLKDDIILGILAGLSITTKQTSGLFICLALLGNKLLFVRDKNAFRIYLKNFMYRIIGISIPILVFLLYLIINNAFFEFVDYTIKGLIHFNNIISYKQLIKLDVVGILSILVPITFIYTWVETVFLEKNRVEFIFLVYGLAIFTLCFPISDKEHLLVGIVPTLILILYKIYNGFKRIYDIKVKNKVLIDRILFCFFIIVILTVICFVIANFVKYLNMSNEYCDKKHFKFLLISEENKKTLEEVGEYIKLNDDVKIIDVRASVYMIINDKYNKDYDMLNRGNLGFNGEERIIKEISESKNIKYLVLKEKYQINWQTPYSVVKFIRNNKTKIGDVSIYDIYE